MDTHITSTPDLEGAGSPLGSPIRLPGERGTLPHFELHGDTSPPNLEHQDSTAANQPPAGDASAPAVPTKARPSRRRRLLGTAAAVVLLAGTGGVLWLQRQGMVNLPFPTSVTTALGTGVDLPFPASLSAMARATGAVATNAAATPPTIAEVGGPAVPTIPQATATVPVAAQAPAHARPPAAAPALLPPSPDMTDFAAFKSGDGPSEVGARQTPRATSKPASASLPSLTSGEAGTAVTLPSTPQAVAFAEATASAVPAQAAVPTPAPVPAPVPAPATVVAAASPAPVSAPVAVPKPRDPVQTAIDLRAEPMSPKQQVDAVGLVRELGAQLKDTRLTVAQLSETVADLKQQLEARTTEFDSRLTLSEAGTVLAESAKAGGATHPLSTAQSGAPYRAVPAPRPVAPPASSTVPAPAHPSSTRTVKDFRIQGASPGLAVLNVLTPAAGEAPVLYLALGDQVPGLGRIKTISQRGTSWVVQTDGGLIQ